MLGVELSPGRAKNGRAAWHGEVNESFYSELRRARSAEPRKFWRSSGPVRCPCCADARCWVRPWRLRLSKCLAADMSRLIADSRFDLDHALSHQEGMIADPLTSAGEVEFVEGDMWPVLGEFGELTRGGLGRWSHVPHLEQAEVSAGLAPRHTRLHGLHFMAPRCFEVRKVSRGCGYDACVRERIRFFFRVWLCSS